MATMNVLNATGGTETVEKPMSVENNALLTTIDAKLALLNGYVDQLESYVDGLEGAIASSNTKLDSLVTQGASTAPVPVAQADEYETVAASTTAALGATGATGDRLSHVVIIPASTSPGAVQIKDGSGTAITIFAGGASSVTTLHPFVVPLGLKSLAGAWTIITNGSVSAIGVGDFT